MKLQIVSDIHLETRRNYPHITKIGDFLALLGDIGNPFSMIYKDFLLLQASKFDKVFLCLGNHEHYYHTYDETVKKVQEIASETNNIFLLNRTRIDLDENTILLGATLWSFVSDEHKTNILQKINDFRLIKDWSVETNNKQHALDVEWISNEIQCDKNVIVMTHHTPLLKDTCHPIYEGNDICTAFSTDLSKLLKHPIKIWMSGHTHYSYDFMFNETRLVSNQMGYSGEHPETNYIDGKCIEF